MANLPYMSSSRLSLFRECPQRYKFRYVDKLPEQPHSYFSFGSTVHAALEEFVKPLTLAPPQPAGTLDDLLAAYDRAWLRDGYSSQEEEYGYYEKGRRILTDWHREFVAKTPTPVGVEKELSVMLDGVKLNGVIDRLDYVEGEGLNVVDYKTGVRLSQRDADSSDQLTIYQILAERSYNLPVARLSLAHLTESRIYTTKPRSPEEVERVVVALQETAALIRDDRFDPTPGQHCGRCEYKNRCPAWAGR